MFSFTFISSFRCYNMSQYVNFIFIFIISTYVLRNVHWKIKLPIKVDQWQPSTPPLTWKWLPFAGVTVEAIRDFKIQRPWQQRESKKKKTIGSISKTTTLYVHHTCLNISLHVFARLRREHAWFRVLWSTYLDMVPRNSTPGGFAYIWQSKWIEIITIKSERTQIHLLSVVLVAVALYLEVPIMTSTLSNVPWRLVQSALLISGRHCWHQSCGFGSFGAKQ